MSRPVSRRVATVERDLRERGFVLETDARVTIAHGDATTLAAVDAPLAVIPLTDSRSLSVVSAVAYAAQRGWVPILVADSHTRSTAQDLLSTPFALAKHADHRRRFYNIEDRIRLTDDTFACVDTRGSLQWAEAPEAAATDSPSIQLAAGNEMVAVLDSVDYLTCPGPEPEAFPARYTRSDGRVRVLNSEGEIAQYGTIATMRADGYRPIPLPLIPEHHVREQPSLARATLFASIANGTVVYDPIQ